METKVGEIWATIPGNERYEVSNRGVIYDTKLFKELRQHYCDDYLHVTITLNRKQHWSFAVHRIVVWAFLGVLSTRSRQVNHKDGNKDNNYLSNLELVTPSENVRHAYRTGLRGTVNLYKSK